MDAQKRVLNIICEAITMIRLVDLQPEVTLGKWTGSVFEIYNKYLLFTVLPFVYAYRYFVTALLSKSSQKIFQLRLDFCI